MRLLTLHVLKRWTVGRSNGAVISSTNILDELKMGFCPMAHRKILTISLAVSRVCFYMGWEVTKSTDQHLYHMRPTLAGLSVTMTSAFAKITISCSKSSGFCKNASSVLLRLYKSQRNVSRGMNMTLDLSLHQISNWLALRKRLINRFPILSCVHYDRTYPALEPKLWVLMNCT